MRIISQNGDLDINYDQHTVCINAQDHRQIIAFPFSVTDNEFGHILGDYATYISALDVMQQIREAYKGSAQETEYGYFVKFENYVFEMPHADEVKDK